MEEKKKDKFDEAIDILEKYVEGTPPRSSKFEGSCLCGGHEEKKKDKKN